MTKSKSKSLGLAKLPPDQQYHSLLGPSASWYKPDISDLWTQPAHEDDNEDNGEHEASDHETSMDCDTNPNDRPAAGATAAAGNSGSNELSYFAYGSKGCFCYGQVYRSGGGTSSSSIQPPKISPPDNLMISAQLKQLVKIKDDNEYVCCVRFLKNCKLPILMALTRSGSLVLQDCITNKTLVHFRGDELIDKFVIPQTANCTNGDEHCSKKVCSSVQQIISFAWPNVRHIFLAIRPIKTRTNLLIWARLKDIRNFRNNPQSINKRDIIEASEQLELNLPQYPAPICCLKSTTLDSHKDCLLAVGMDDGLITVVRVHLERGQAEPILLLARHRSEICSMSFYAVNGRRLLASVSRDALVLVWDLENPSCDPFADYVASNRPKDNWFTLSFLPSKQASALLAINNPYHSLSVLKIPDSRPPHKVRLRDITERTKQRHGTSSELKHVALIFNIVHDPSTDTVMTSSYDSNHIFWSCRRSTAVNSAKTTSKNHSDGPPGVELKPQYLHPGMPSDARAHMLRYSPIRENLFAMALGKAGLRFCQAGERPSHNATSRSEGFVVRKIREESHICISLAWHPSHEYRLAVGTLKGKVLRIDLTPGKATIVEAEPTKSPDANLDKESSDCFDVEYTPVAREKEFGNGQKLFSHANSDITPSASKGPRPLLEMDGIYSLCWGPNPTSPEDISRSSIYAVGGNSHRLFIYHSGKKEGGTDAKLTNYLDEFADRSLPEARGSVTEVAWKPSMDLMAVGTTEGTIIVVRFLEESHVDMSHYHLFERLAKIEALGSNSIQCLAWHPTTDKSDYEHYYCLAAAAHGSPVYVFNLRESLLAADVKDRLKIDAADRINEGTDEASSSNNTQGRLGTVSLPVSSYAHKLDAHKKTVADIAWSPHQVDELATASFDRQCIVWRLVERSPATGLSDDDNPTDDNDDSTNDADVATSDDDANDKLTSVCPNGSANRGGLNQSGSSAIIVDSQKLALLTSTNHRQDECSSENHSSGARLLAKFIACDRLFTVNWSITDGDLLYTSGNDSTVWAWRPSENPYSSVTMKKT